MQSFAMSHLVALLHLYLLLDVAAQPPSEANGALRRQLERLEDHPYADYVLVTDMEHDKAIRLMADGARISFRVAFDAARGIHPQVPLAARQQAVRSMFDLLALGAKKHDCHPEDFRKQLTEEFEFDPLSVKNGADYLTEEAYSTVLQDPRFESINQHGLDDLVQMFAPEFTGGHEEL